MSESIECPYCEEYVDIEMDCEHYEGTQEYQCPQCEKNFEVLAEPYISYTGQGKADCLNGEEHTWKQIVGCPDIYFKGKYRCENCSATHTVEEELSTKDEWSIYYERD